MIGSISANGQPALRRAGLNDWSAGTSASKLTKTLKIKLQKMKKELSAGTKDEQRTTADYSTSVSLAQNGMLSAAMSVEDILKLRNQLPDDWRWTKCYELSYINSRTGHGFIKKHWALTPPDGKGLVCSLGLISHDNFSTKKEFFEDDTPVEWVEKSLLIVDSLLAEIERLKGSR